VIEPILVLILDRARSSWIGFRYRSARRSVADSLPHCMNAPHRTLQAKKRGKISEKWEYTV